MASSKIRSRFVLAVGCILTVAVAVVVAGPVLTSEGHKEDASGGEEIASASEETASSCCQHCTTHQVAAKSAVAAEDQQWVVYQGTEGPGVGKSIVFISGDEEYRSEETLTHLARILAVHHGFKCTVLYAVNPESGEIDPNYIHNIPGLEALDDADLMVIFTRFRDLPDDQMQHIVDYVDSGKPIIGLRTATHAFNIPDEKTFSEYSWRGGESGGGFGREVLGETWVNHHGHHGSQSTRGVLVEEQAEHPILSGVAGEEIWGTSDVYTVNLPLPGDAQPLVLGQVLVGMEPEDEPVEGVQNEPMMPVAWTKTYEAANGNTARVFCTTMGASQDFVKPGLRRLLVNATYWCLGMEDDIDPAGSTETVGEFDPLPFGNDRFATGVKPADLALTGEEAKAAGLAECEDGSCELPDWETAEDESP